MKSNIKEIIKNRFVSYCGHKTDTFFPHPDGDVYLKDTKGFVVSFPEYKKTPRVFYTKVSVDEFSYRLVPSLVKDLPKPLTGKKSIVSRDTLRAVKNIERRILDESPELKTITGLERIRKVPFEMVNAKLPLLWEIIKKIETRTDQRIFYNLLKTYINRTDLYAPGQQVRDSDNKIIAAWMLIHDLD